MTTITGTDVLLYIPNIIGYARILSVLISFVLMILYPDGDLYVLSTVLYLLGFVGDLFDGYAARKCNQTSTFGGTLDMVTDRCGTLGLLYVLAIDCSIDRGYHPLYRLSFVFLAILDVSSHWFQTYCSLSMGMHHKSDDANARRNILVRWFYRYYWFFGYLCVGAELTYIFTYLLLHIHQQQQQPQLVVFILRCLLALCIPGCIAKQIVNLAQLLSSCRAIADYDAHIKNQTHK